MAGFINDKFRFGFAILLIIGAIATFVYGLIEKIYYINKYNKSMISKFRSSPEKSGRLRGVLKSGLSGGFMFSVSFPR